MVIGDYVVTRHLGAGSFATVYKGHHRSTGAVVAIKAISLRRLDRKSLENLESEISIMKRVKHHNIVRMLDVQVRACGRRCRAPPPLRPAAACVCTRDQGRGGRRIMRRND